MAVPRVFVSSTCYDLQEVREAVGGFCEGFGFDAVLSDRGDVFFHPDLHTHDSCLFEVQNCHMLVLVIGGRFGGGYVANKTQSITNAEYAAARIKKLPIFCFVKQDVLDNHNLWQKNKNKTFSSEIVYPAIEKQENAENIFNFIDEVRHSSSNNGLFGFRLGRDIEHLLRKQISGMFFDYLSKRSLSNELQTTNDAVQKLSLVTSSIEELVKRMYRNDKEDPAQVIEKIDRAAAAERFFFEVTRQTKDKELFNPAAITFLSTTTEKNWTKALAETSFLDFGFNEDSRDYSKEIATSFAAADKVLTYMGSRPIANEQGHLFDVGHATSKLMSEDWLAFLALPEEKKRQILSGYAYDPPKQRPISQARKQPI